jgi:AraC-like DNA-binding protein
VLKGGRVRLSALETIDLSICPGTLGARPRNQISYQSLGFARAIAEFETDLSQPLSPAILAKRSGLSSNRLGRLTKRLFSLTPSQLLAKTRVAAASLLLRESTLSIVDIAHHCGYADQIAFTRAFRTLTSVTPSEFRRSEALPKN